eukprot:SAG31_NODE_4929_length_2855_cov_1.699057_1_plen_63_part_00
MLTCPHAVPSTMMLTVKKIEPFQLVAYYKHPEELPPDTRICLGVWKFPVRMRGLYDSLPLRY